MKTFLRMLAFASAIVCMMLFANSCSSQSSAKDVAEQSMECLKKGDFDQFTKFIYISESTSAEDAEKTRAMYKALYESKGKLQLEKKQGIKSYEVVEEKMNDDGDRCKIVFKIYYGDGSEKEDTFTTRKDKDGKWWIEP